MKPSNLHIISSNTINYKFAQDILIDYLCDHDISKILITNYTTGDIALISMLSLTEIPIEVEMPTRNCGALPIISSQFAMIRRATHALIFNDHSTLIETMIYMVTRNDLKIKVIECCDQ